MGFHFSPFLQLQASFDQYLEDKPRVFTAIFPDKRRSQQLNEVELLTFSSNFSFFFIIPQVGICIVKKSREKANLELKVLTLLLLYCDQLLKFNLVGIRD